MRGTHLFIDKFAQLVHFYHIKNNTKHTDVVLGSNESLWHVDYGVGPDLREYSPLRDYFSKLECDG